LGISKTTKRMIRAITAVALFTTYYNFVRIHKTLRVTPAMGGWRV
jgi:hypothetical protein